MKPGIKTVANALLRAACEHKGTELSTVDTVVQEVVPYWEALAKAAMVATLNLPEVKSLSR